MCSFTYGRPMKVDAGAGERSARHEAWTALSTRHGRGAWHEVGLTGGVR
jgi:hypothetical protein